MASSDYNIAGAMATRFGCFQPQPSAEQEERHRQHGPCESTGADDHHFGDRWCSQAVSPRGRQLRAPSLIPSTATDAGSPDWEAIPLPSPKVAPGTRTPGAEASASTINQSQCLPIMAGVGPWSTWVGSACRRRVCVYRPHQPH